MEAPVAEPEVALAEEAVVEAVAEPQVSEPEPAPEPEPELEPTPEPAPEPEPEAVLEATPEAVDAIAEPEAAEDVAETTPEGSAEDAPVSEAEVEAQSDSVAEVVSEPAAETELDPEVEPGTEPETGTAPDAEPESASTATAAAYAVDESVLAILREEAEREAQARRAEVRALETQPDLGVDTVMPERSKPALVVANAAEEVDTGKPSARRDLLPDVEEINSSLRPNEAAIDPDQDFATPLPREAKGFRSGFLVVMTVAIIGAAVYITAPRLSGSVPSLSGPLTAYVGAVDGLRLGLDGLMRSATAAINGE